MIRTDVPQAARVWNYLMGGKDYYVIDQITGDLVVEQYPDISRMAVQSRQFLVRAVRFLVADAGVRQVLDIGCGLPTMQNTHEVAQSVVPESKIIYVDNDPLVLTHARALMQSRSPEGVTTYIDSDFHFPEQIISDAHNVFDFNEPIGVLFMGVLGYAKAYDDALRIVNTMMNGLPEGSYLALWDGTNDSKAYVSGCEARNRARGVPYIPRPQNQILGFFHGLDVVEPGFVPITHWQSDEPDVGKVRPVSAYGAVARKP
ncbi:SAM-dependent methyltransferase [Nocardia sp. NPDC050710]|uniref:SAM-dependent methyltransferase n=1 Tax=Nocardia sp. NPDC050710 TaxID=3157220 RepID=UPI0033F42492